MTAFCARNELVLSVATGEAFLGAANGGVVNFEQPDTSVLLIFREVPNAFAGSIRKKSANSESTEHAISFANLTIGGRL